MKSVKEKTDIVYVRFPEQVNTLTFERLLSSSLAKSRRKDCKKVTLDFRWVQWCEIFELSLLTLWIFDLRRRGKDVEFLYPSCEPTASDGAGDRDRITRRQHVCSYLNRWDFDDFLRARSVEVHGHDQYYPYWPLNPQQDSILPLRFFQDEQDLTLWLQNLRDSKQLALLFRETFSLPIVGSGGIRDTILREIGQNIYQHAQGKCAFITMGVIPALKDEQSVAMRYARANGLEKSFFRHLGKSGYLQLVIADHGPGIMKTLKQAYMEDSRTPADDRRRPKETKIMDFAFLRDTTRKGQIPGEGTGLYWVKEMVKKNQGLLVVRSGSSILRYDFLTGQELAPFKSNLDDDDLKDLAGLGGTQFKIYFPLNPELTLRRETPRSELYVGGAGFSKRTHYSVLELHKYGKWSPEKMSGLLSAFPSPQPRILKVVIVDFARTTWTKDTIVNLLQHIAAAQDKNLIAVAINTDHISQILKIAYEVLAERILSNPSKLKPILVLEGSNFEIAGLSPEDKRIVNEVSKQGTDTLPEFEYRSFITRNNHLFVYDSEERILRLRLDTKELSNEIADHYRSTLADAISDPTNEMFYPGQFLLPTNSYVEGYFRISPLLTSETRRREIAFIVINSILRLAERPDCLVTTSADIAELGSEIAEKLELVYGLTIRHLPMEDIRDEDRNAFLLTPHFGRSVVILTTVIGTGRSLERLLEVSGDPRFAVDVVKIIALVDARDVNEARLGTTLDEKNFLYKGIRHDLERIKSQPLTFHDEIPSGWRREDIRRIDPKTNAPDPIKTEPTTQPLWTPADSFFFGNVVRNASALSVGHFARRRRHYIYFIDMVRIAKSVGPEIAAKIKKDLLITCKNSDKKDPEVTAIIYNEQSRGAKYIADFIAKEFPPSEPCSIQLATKDQKLQKRIHGKDIVICVGIVGTGSHLQRLLDSVAAFGPSRIFAYGITHRKESDSVPFFQRIEKYSGSLVRMRYFVEMEIPAHNTWDCPACNLRDELRKLKDYCDDSILRGLIVSEWESLAYRQIEDEGGIEAPTEEEITESVRQAIVRRQLGASKRDPLAWFLIDILDSRQESRDEMLRLLEVMSREIVLFKTYKQLFSQTVITRLREACLFLLETPSDELGRERHAIRVLRYIAPHALIENLVPIFRGVAQKPSVLIQLFMELLAVIREHDDQRINLADLLSLCQSVFETDEPFIHMSIEDIRAMQHLLNYSRRKLRLERVQADGAKFPWSPVAKLWAAFIEQSERVHPRLTQEFPNVTTIFSADAFRQAYTLSYIGSDNFADLVERVIPEFEAFADCLRPEIQKSMAYFLAKDAQSFRADYYILDDSIRTLATLDTQRRLTDEQVDRLFYKNPDVNAAVQRLREHAFDENTSTIRKVLLAKFPSIHEIIHRSVTRWEKLLSERGVTMEYSERHAMVFVPAPIIENIIDGLLQNIYEHAFEPETERKIVRLSTNQQVGDILIDVCDNGKGTSPEHVNQRPNGGIRRSQKLLARYGGTVEILSGQQAGYEEFTTVARIKLLTKEKVIWGVN